jgi:hypothetical protein
VEIAVDTVVVAVVEIDVDMIGAVEEIDVDEVVFDSFLVEKNVHWVQMNQVWAYMQPKLDVVVAVDRVELDLNKKLFFYEEKNGLVVEEIVVFVLPCSHLEG